MPCPIGSVAIVEPDQSLRGIMMPGDSPGKSSPVADPKPNFFMYSASFAPPRSRPILIVPTFEDCSMISATVIVSVACECESLKTRS